MKPIAYADLRKPTARRHISTVARINANFDEIADHLKARPRTFGVRLWRGAPEDRYRSIFLLLSNGANAALTEWEFEPGRIDLALEVIDHVFVYEDDYCEVISELQVDSKKVQKLHTFDMTWLESRKAKKIARPQPELPEDWWNHVRVVSRDKS